MPSDDRDGLLLSVTVHVVVVLLLALAMRTEPETLDPDYPPQLMEIEFGPAPTLPVIQGEPRRAEAAAPSQAAQQPEPERPAPPAATPTRVPERRPTPPRERPIPRPVQSDDARPARPNPPSRATQPERNPTAPTQPDPASGTGRTTGDAPTAGTDAGRGTGSGGDAPAEVGFQFGNRDFSCPSPPFGGIEGTAVYRVTFAPNGRLKASSPVNRNADLHASVMNVINRCRASPLPPNARQVDQATRATFVFRAN